MSVRSQRLLMKRLWVSTVLLLAAQWGGAGASNTLFGASRAAQLVCPQPRGLYPSLVCSAGGGGDISFHLAPETLSLHVTLCTQTSRRRAAAHGHC